MSVRLPIGKRHIEILSKYTGTAAIYGTTASLLVLYFTDWKVTNRWIPYYGSAEKFKIKPKEE